MLSAVHRLHLQGRFRTVVSGLILSSLPFRHAGQIAHPFCTVILPRIKNFFHSLCAYFSENILNPKTEKNRKGYSFFRFLFRFGFLRRGAFGSIYLIHIYSPYPFFTGPSLAIVTASGGAVSVT